MNIVMLCNQVSQVLEQSDEYCSGRAQIQRVDIVRVTTYKLYYYIVKMGMQYKVQQID